MKLNRQTFLLRERARTPSTAWASVACYMLEKDMAVELQKRRSELLFLHSAAVERGNEACLLAAEAGSGKSTTTWALLHHGFRRTLSDRETAVD